MATVTGNLKDITGGSMDSKEGVIIFTLNRPNISVGTGGVRPDNSRTVTPDSDTGEFSINLEPTDQMAVDAWYDVSIEWLGEKAPLIGYLGIKVRVPSSGGQIDQIIDRDSQSSNPNRRIVWVGQEPPSSPYPYMLWLQQEPGSSPDPFDPLNTSILHEWRP